MPSDAVKMTLAEWKAEGLRRFGEDQMKWRFVCPLCGHVATPADWKAAGAPSSAVAFSCVGRWAKLEKPCDYAGGGLFRLNPVTVTTDTGEPVQMFAFAEPQEAQCPTK